MIFYTVFHGLEGFPVQFISAGQVGNFPGPFADPGEACQEFECCYQPGATKYLEPVDFNKRAAGLPAFGGLTASIVEIDALHAPGTARDQLFEIRAAVAALKACPWSGHERDAYVLGALTGMLRGLIGENAFCGHNSTFDEQTTKAIEELLAELDKEV
jgi:hypothetical protein